MHADCKRFFEYVKERHPRFFNLARVLDVGSYDVNGNNRYLFTDCEYVGLDIVEGPNVTIVSRAKDYHPDMPFDTIISGNTFEHDAEWKDSLRNIFHLLRAGGLLTFSCSGPGTKEHGTSKASPDASAAHTIWGDYYQNLTEEDIREGLNLDQFSPFKLNLITRDKGMGTDIQFWGIKR